MIGTYIVLCALVCLALALDDYHLAKILDYQSEHTPGGHYFFRFGSSDGISREEEGTRLDEHIEDSPIVVKGSYSYTDETGKVFTVRYVADENGFHPEGDHIQVPAYVINPTPENKVLIPAAPTPLRFVQTTPLPQLLASPVGRFSLPVTTPRPEVSTTPTRIQIPLESKVESKSVAFNDLDKKVQESIVDILANGRNARGFRSTKVKSF